MRVLAAFFATAAVAALAPFGAAGGPTALPRASADRPDDYRGLQIHAIYAVPSDAPDRAFDTDGSIESSTNAYQTWLAAQTGGRTLRFDTFQGSLDVTFHRLPRSDAEYASQGLFSQRLLEQDLRTAGHVGDAKLYVVYFDSSNGAACGGAAWPPTLPGNVAAFYLRGRVGASPPCLSSGFAPAGAPPRYTEFAVLHEVLHPMGIVGTCAAHHTRSGHVSETPNDLMYAGNEPWTPSVLDFGHDDYFSSSSSDCPDLTRIGFLRADLDFVLTVRKSGSGIVRSDPWPVLDCGAVCATPFPRGTVVRLRALGPFERWSGACSGTGDCHVTMGAARSVTAHFRTATARVCRVPKVVGRRLATARRLVARAGCRVGRVRRIRSARRNGTVVRQAPRAGSRVRRGTRVALTVSRGRR
jgi:PASTA domain